MVYPTFLATIAENVHPSNRAESVGAFRLWRDLGYAAGAVLTGILADAFSLQVAVAAIAMLTFGSAMVIWQRMYCLEKAPGALPEKRIAIPFLGKIKTSGPACRKTLPCQSSPVPYQALPSLVRLDRIKSPTPKAWFYAQ